MGDVIVRVMPSLVPDVKNRTLRAIKTEMLGSAFFKRGSKGIEVDEDTLWGLDAIPLWSDVGKPSMDQAILLRWVKEAIEISQDTDLRNCWQGATLTKEEESKVMQIVRDDPEGDGDPDELREYEEIQADFMTCMEWSLKRLCELVGIPWSFGEGSRGGSSMSVKDLKVIAEEALGESVSDEVGSGPIPDNSVEAQVRGQIVVITGRNSAHQKWVIRSYLKKMGARSVVSHYTADAVVVYNPEDPTTKASQGRRGGNVMITADAVIAAAESKGLVASAID